ncbi:DNA cytosine methyltransferase [Corynebacterium pseudopelargi]|uniref:Cytosine-specific methyltransferase n=1 Tax=Corynebacterium pseudopelargi TaxID=2080757 RepID=A0A3G6IVP1_9CORY|nr:DNA (cytosine-5-)-methyltransferase [Corynebacterium pseudopelargi]AZA08728.1 putative BsuMI modification methylase subunit YdiP [Corynebacterium pseudopelargi]
MKNHHSDLKVGSLFSGYGGLDLAVEHVFGATPAWFVEFDEAPSKILAHHWPDVPNLGDVTKIDWSKVEPVDIIIGGSPCQDLSAAGKRAGMTEGTRSNLWVNMRQAIDQLRPRYVIWENVQGALSAAATSDSDMEPGFGQVGDRGARSLRALGRVCGDLAEIGYDTRWTTLRVSDIGGCHHRARIFLLGTRQDVTNIGSSRMETN